jgi:predicted DNA-binding transcriptional regulator YafY
VSRATFKRDLEYLRDRLNAPIVWDREAWGYRYETAPASGQHALPGLWFNASEAHALLLMQAMLSELQPTWLKSHIAPLRARLRAVLESGQHSAEEVERRFRLISVAARPVEDRHFEVVAAALLKRQKLDLVYRATGSNQTTQRVVSPQLLIHYRGTWYLSGWCHTKQAMRSFSADAMEAVKPLQEAALEMDPVVLDAFVGRGYGIFSGGDVQWATLKFSPERARWVVKERWHPQQTSTWTDDGHLLLKLPFTDMRELAMDVLRHGQHVEVLEPLALREATADALRAALALYSSDGHAVTAVTSGRPGT